MKDADEKVILGPESTSGFERHDDVSDVASAEDRNSSGRDAEPGTSKRMRGAIGNPAVSVRYLCDMGQLGSP